MLAKQAERCLHLPTLKCSSSNKRNEVFLFMVIDFLNISCYILVRCKISVRLDFIDTSMKFCNFTVEYFNDI